jgi:hypothetical protein
MNPMDSIERRMAALFLLLMGLVLWQALRTRPLKPASYVSVLEAGEQVFPVAVPPGAPLRPPADPAARLAFLKEHAVEGFEAFPAGSCEAFVRVSAHHWLRLPVTRENPLPQETDMDWLAKAETEVFCPP